VANEIKQFPDTDAKVFSRLFFTFSLYYRRRDDQENYYQNALQYLAYTASSELSEAEKKDISIKMGMSVLLGKNIYNITELLEKEVLNSLKGSDFEWLYHLLQHLGHGQISEFAAALNTYNSQL
jgi:26S proteasome regulatory subunit N9